MASTSLGFGIRWSIMAGSEISHMTADISPPCRSHGRGLAGHGDMVPHVSVQRKDSQDGFEGGKVVDAGVVKRETDFFECFAPLL